MTPDSPPVVPAAWLIGEYRALIDDVAGYIERGVPGEEDLVGAFTVLMSRAGLLARLTPAVVIPVAGNATSVATNQGDTLASVSTFPVSGERFDDASGLSPHPRHDTNWSGEPA